MELKTDKVNSKLEFNVVLSCFLAYTFSMCMKMAYSASMATIKGEYGISNIIASLPLTLYYVFYAIIQFALAVFITKVNIKRYMLITFSLSGISYISLFFFSPVWYVCAVLAINGILHGAVWCGSVMTFSKFLSKKNMSKALLFMGVGFSAGSAMSFGIGALAIHLGNWRISFLVFGCAFLLSTVYMIYSVKKAEKANLKPPQETFIESATTCENIYAQNNGKTARQLVIMSIIVIFFASLLYYVYTNWLPSILKAVFLLSDSKSTLITALFPIAIYAGPVLSVYVSKKLKSDFTITFTISLLLMGVSLLLCFIFDINIVLTVAAVLFAGVLLRLINYVLSCLVPVHTQDVYNSGSTSAIVNASACISAAASPFIMGLVLDLSGESWNIGFAVLFGFSVLTLLFASVFLIINGKKK